MSDNEDIIENNQEVENFNVSDYSEDAVDIESNEEVPKKALLSLRNVLITLASLTAIVSLVLGGIYVRRLLAASDTSMLATSEVQNTHIVQVNARVPSFQLYKRSEKARENVAKVESEDEMIGEFLEISVEESVPSDLIAFENERSKIFILDPETLEAKLLFNTTRKFGDGPRVSRNKKLVYFVDSSSKLKFINVENRKVVGEIPLPGYFERKGFALNEPDFNDVVYVARSIKGDKLIRQYNIIDHKIVKDFINPCGVEHPIILARANENIFYRCRKSMTVYLKDLGTTHIPDKELFELPINSSLVLSPNGSKVIVYDLNGFIWTIYDITLYKLIRSSIGFRNAMNGIKSLSFSHDQRNVWALTRDGLYKIDLVTALRTPKRLNLDAGQPLPITWNDAVDSNIVYSASPDVLLFANGNDIWKVDLSKQELQSELVKSTNYVVLSSPQFSKNETQVYYIAHKQIDRYNINTDENVKLPLPNMFKNPSFLLQKPDLNKLFYVAELGTEAKIRHYDLKKGQVLRDYGHKCEGKHAPIILAQLNNNSELIYRCTSSQSSVYMKDLDDPTAEDVEIFQNSINDFVIVSRDNSHVVNCGKTTCTIIDLSEHSDLSKHRTITLPRELSEFKAVQISNDNKLIYILAAAPRDREDRYQLITINYQEVLNRPEVEIQDTEGILNSVFFS